MCTLYLLGCVLGDFPDKKHGPFEEGSNLVTTLVQLQRFRPPDCISNDIQLGCQLLHLIHTDVCTYTYVHLAITTTFIRVFITIQLRPNDRDFLQRPQLPAIWVVCEIPSYQTYVRT